MHKEDIRWLAVFKRVYEKLPWHIICRDLRQREGFKKSVRRWILLYERTGEVMENVPRQRIFDFATSLKLIQVLLDSPGDYLEEIRAKFQAASGIRAEMSTICRAIKAAGFSRKQVTARAPAMHRPSLCVCDSPTARLRALSAACACGSQLRAYSRRRSEHDYRVFRHKIRTRYRPEQLLFLDETAKDGRSLRRSFGYAIRGCAPIAANALHPRGARYSSLCAFDVNGFVDWEHTDGTYNMERFLEAAELAVLPHITPYPGPRSAGRCRGIERGMRRGKGLVSRPSRSHTPSLASPLRACEPAGGGARQRLDPQMLRVCARGQLARRHRALPAAVLLRLDAAGQWRLWLRAPLAAAAREMGRERRRAGGPGLRLREILGGARPHPRGARERARARAALLPQLLRAFLYLNLKKIDLDPTSTASRVNPRAQNDHGRAASRPAPWARRPFRVMSDPALFAQRGLLTTGSLGLEGGGARCSWRWRVRRRTPGRVLGCGHEDGVWPGASA